MGHGDRWVSRLRTVVVLLVILQTSTLAYEGIANNCAYECRFNCYFFEAESFAETCLTSCGCAGDRSQQHGSIAEYGSCLSTCEYFMLSGNCGASCLTYHPNGVAQEVDHNMYHLRYEYADRASEDFLVEIPKYINPENQETMIEDVVKYLAKDSDAMATLRQQGTIEVVDQVPVVEISEVSSMPYLLAAIMLLAFFMVLKALFIMLKPTASKNEYYSKSKSASFF